MALTLQKHTMNTFNVREIRAAGEMNVKVAGKVNLAFTWSLKNTRDKEIIGIMYHRNDLRHNCHCPSFLPKGSNGASASWEMYGLRHRVDGYTYKRRIGLEEWHIYGVRVDNIYDEYV